MDQTLPWPDIGKEIDRDRWTVEEVPDPPDHFRYIGQWTIYAHAYYGPIDAVPEVVPFPEPSVPWRTVSTGDQYNYVVIVAF